MLSTVTELSVFLPGPAGRLEAIWTPSVTSSGRAAVICHPHPLYGGTMSNKVVTTLARVWREAGVATLRFNFRGVGASAGVHDEGRGEQDDLRAVLLWLRDTQGITEVAVAGFSFGAWVACAVVDAGLPPELRLTKLVLVAPPVQYSGFAELQPPADTLVLQGDDDDIVAPAAVAAWVASRRSPPVLLRFSQAGHFFHGRLAALKAELAARI